MIEKDFVQKYWRRITVLFIAMICLEAWCIRHAPASPTLHLLSDLWLAIGPNLIASLIALLIGYLVFRSLRRKLYMNTMRSIRRALQEMPAAHRLSSDQAHAFMKLVVPVISSLYFDGGEPEVTEPQRSETETKPSCSSCENPHPVVLGCCSHCKDLPESFLPEDRLSPALK